jgi:hypothetical protein
MLAETSHLSLAMTAGMRSVALPREPEEQSNRDAEPKGSQHKPSANIETDSPHHQETNRDKNSGKLRVHLHHAHNARVAIGIAVLHVVNCLTGRYDWPRLLNSPCVVSCTLTTDADGFHA